MFMAYKAGAELMNMEFQQFFPYACYIPSCEMLLAGEAHSFPSLPQDKQARLLLQISSEPQRPTK